jgi:RNA polymerase sigma factor (sigma-70 family)
MSVANFGEELLCVQQQVLQRALARGFQLADAEEMASEAVLRLLSVQERIDERGMRPYGARIGHNLIEDARRSAARIRCRVGLPRNDDGALLHEPEAPTPDPPSAAASQELVARINEFLQTRSSTVRQLVSLRSEHGLTLKEAALRLGLPLSKVIRLYYRLRDDLEAICLGE